MLRLERQKPTTTRLSGTDWPFYGPVVLTHPVLTATSEGAGITAPTGQGQRLRPERLSNREWAVEWDSHPGSWHGSLWLHHCCSTRKRGRVLQAAARGGGEDRRVSFTSDCVTTLQYRYRPCPTRDVNATRQSMRVTGQRSTSTCCSDSAVGENTGRQADRAGSKFSSATHLLESSGKQLM